MPDKNKTQKPTRDSVSTEQPGEKGRASQSTKDVKGPSARPNPDREDDDNPRGQEVDDDPAATGRKR
jgi:hypothetical protein